MGLQLRAWVKKTVHKVENIDSPVKKKFPAQRPVKKVILTVFWDMKGPITIDFLEKDATVNIVSYHQLLRKNSPSFDWSESTWE